MSEVAVRPFISTSCDTYNDSDELIDLSGDAS